MTKLYMLIFEGQFPATFDDTELPMARMMQQRRGGVLYYIDLDKTQFEGHRPPEGKEKCLLVVDGTKTYRRIYEDTSPDTILRACLQADDTGGRVFLLHFIMGRIHRLDELCRNKHKHDTTKFENDGRFKRAMTPEKDNVRKRSRGQ